LVVFEKSPIKLPIPVDKPANKVSSNAYKTLSSKNKILANINAFDE